MLVVGGALSLRFSDQLLTKQTKPRTIRTVNSKNSSKHQPLPLSDLSDILNRQRNCTQEKAETLRRSPLREPNEYRIRSVKANSSNESRVQRSGCSSSLQSFSEPVRLFSMGERNKKQSCAVLFFESLFVRRQSSNFFCCDVEKEMKEVKRIWKLVTDQDSAILLFQNLRVAKVVTTFMQLNAMEYWAAFLYSANSKKPLLSLKAVLKLKDAAKLTSIKVVDCVNRGNSPRQLVRETNGRIPLSASEFNYKVLVSSKQQYLKHIDRVKLFFSQQVVPSRSFELGGQLLALLSRKKVHCQFSHAQEQKGLGLQLLKSELINQYYRTLPHGVDGKEYQIMGARATGKVSIQNLVGELLKRNQRVQQVIIKAGRKTRTMAAQPLEQVEQSGYCLTALVHNYC